MRNNNAPGSIIANLHIWVPHIEYNIKYYTRRTHTSLLGGIRISRIKSSRLVSREMTACVTREVFQRMCIFQNVSVILCYYNGGPR